MAVHDATDSNQRPDDFTTITSPGTTPKINSIFDFSAEALGQLKLWLEQSGLALPITNVVGYETVKTYTPAWTGSVTNPALGDGTIVGHYTKIGPVVIGFLSLVIGSTTTLGTGFWKFSYPTKSQFSDLVGGSFQLGQGGGLNTAVPVNSSSTVFALEYPGGLVTGAAPAAWVATDNLNGMFIYVSV